MIPTIGRIVVYRLTKDDVTAVNKRREDFEESSPTKADTNTGFVAHVGNDVTAGMQFPLVVTRVWESGLINGQVLLDGNDTLWVTSVTEGDEQGTYSWPTRN